jgi:hypothetical protein
MRSASIHQFVLRVTSLVGRTTPPGASPDRSCPNAWRPLPTRGGSSGRLPRSRENLRSRQTSPSSDPRPGFSGYFLFEPANGVWPRSASSRPRETSTSRNALRPSLSRTGISSACCRPAEDHLRQADGAQAARARRRLTASNRTWREGPLAGLLLFTGAFARNANDDRRGVPCRSVRSARPHRGA